MSCSTDRAATAAQRENIMYGSAGAVLPERPMIITLFLSHYLQCRRPLWPRAASPFTEMWAPGLLWRERWRGMLFLPHFSVLGAGGKVQPGRGLV
ncbi:hypothetical protein GDO81_021868 [Engystomops pustulosus]|uniref:Uncharacterized protein n=1 Tax=Engystomops pustulosus TaxID=76066 RepID=A0AAV6YNQ2_ENGPU|nr:hypothetical protein GDO81_021868 [Engystomops pustulosus]